VLKASVNVTLMEFLSPQYLVGVAENWNGRVRVGGERSSMCSNLDAVDKRVGDGILQTDRTAVIGRYVNLCGWPNRGGLPSIPLPYHVRKGPNGKQ